MVVQRAMALGRRHGIQTIWNPAPALPVSPEAFENVDLLTPNETEIRILLDLPPDDPTDTVELARRLLQRGVSRVVVTLGEKGSVAVTADGSEAFPAVPGVRAVDIIGAGDSFNASLAVSLAEGESLSASVRRVSDAGAYAVQHPGVIGGLPSREAPQAFQRK